MKNVGAFEKRNEEFNLKFSRDEIIKAAVSSAAPTIFDIGAHHGESIEYLKSLFSQAKIFSFEPDPESFDILSKKDVGNVEFFNLAISDEVGTAKFYRNRISHTNSLYKVNLKSKDSVQFAKNRELTVPANEKEYNLDVDVKTITLDKFINDNTIENIDLIKIDVQGAERKVLSGGGGALQKAKAVIVEVSFYDYYKNSTSFMDLEKYLIPAGFELFSILDISRNPMNGRTDWAEVLYRRIN